MDNMDAVKIFREKLAEKGFAWQDAPIEPIAKFMQKYPIVAAIMTIEKETNLSWNKNYLPYWSKYDD